MKLTTKLGLIFLAVIVVVGGGLGFYGIPSIKRYLMDREINYSKSFLVQQVQAIRRKVLDFQREAESGQLSETEFYLEMNNLFVDAKDVFAQHFFHNSARMFVIDEKGEIWQSSDPTKNGVSVSNVWAYDDGKRDRLIREINDRREIAEHVHEFHVQEMDGGGKLTNKTLFIAFLPGMKSGSSFFVCVSENDEDIFYTANWVSKSLILLLAITLLVFYIFFQLFYTRLRKRFDRILEHAQMIAGGNYAALIDDKASDEIGILAQTIDQLAARMSSEKNLEEHQIQGQKMEMIGTLASGIAHDFNNMLGGILSGLELVTQELKSPADKKSPDWAHLANTVRVTNDCANRGKETVEKLLSFSRKREAIRHPLDLNKVIASVQEICQHSFDKRIKIETRGWKEPAIVSADRSLLEQAIMNTCINARDAMNGGGRLTLSVELKRTAPPGSGKRIIREPYYCLTVRDTGTGIDTETLSRIFEPFYTTKEKGTGLGLAMVYKTIDDLGGWLDLDSRVGIGTTFKVFLPLSDQELEGELAGSKTEAWVEPAEPPMRQGRETVLVIDDDEFMLQMTEDILKRLGYDPLAAPDGVKGIELFAENKDKIDIVLLDLMLPDKGGDEIFDHLKELNPDIRVLLISGFKRDPRIADMIVRGCDGFLNKPYSIEDLANSIRDILD